MQYYMYKIREPEIRVVDSLFRFKLALCNDTMTFSDMDSSKTRNQMIIGTNIGIFAVLAIGVFSSFQPSAASLANPGYATSTNIPVAHTPFYTDHIVVTGQNPIN